MWKALTLIHMKRHPKKCSLTILVCTTLCLACMQAIFAQQLFSYGPEELTASIHYNEFLYGIYKNHYKTLPAYPIKGAYSPTGYSNSDMNTSPGLAYGVGACNYIYIHTDEKLQPGHQYRARLSLKLSKAYEQMPYFKAHFGIALTSDLFNNHFGL